jgi:hypothetical protein
MILLKNYLVCEDLVLISEYKERIEFWQSEDRMKDILPFYLSYLSPKKVMCYVYHSHMSGWAEKWSKLTWPKNLW